MKKLAKPFRTVIAILWLVYKAVMSVVYFALHLIWTFDFSESVKQAGGMFNNFMEIEPYGVVFKTAKDFINWNWSDI